MRRGFYLGMATCVLAACGDGESGGLMPPPNSQTIAASRSGQSVYVVGTDMDSVVTYNLSDRSAERVHVGREPSRIAKSGDRVVVSLRGERAVAVLREAGEGKLVLEDRIEVGAEPMGIIVASDKKRAWVAASLSGRVDELDLDTLQVTRSFEIDGQPRWLALHPNEYTLYVASAYQGVLTTIDLSSGYVEKLPLPELKTSFFSPNEDFTDRIPMTSNLAVRLTGDLAVSPDGTLLMVPGIYVDHQRPVFEHDETMTSSTGTFMALSNYAQRVVPVVFQLPIEDSGRPLASRARATPLSAFKVTGPNGLGVSAPFSYPTSITIAPGGDHFVATFESSKGIIHAPMFRAIDTTENGLSGGSGAANIGGSSSAGGGGTLSIPGRRPGLQTQLIAPSDEWFAVITDEGPRGAAYLADGRLFIDTFLARGIVEISQVSFEAGRLIELHPTLADPAVELGRKLFYTANDGRVSGAGTGISCSTCHFDGRDDGLTWNFSVRGGRQTPSLAGQIKLTEPMGWEGTVPTVAEEALRTSRDRMGGFGIEEREALSIERFLNSSREVDVARKGSNEEVVLRGKAIFERADVGCAGCHLGPRMTNNATYAMFGLPVVETRSLIGIAASAPYLHDGSLATLRDVVLASRSGEMGNTGALSDVEIDELVAYLESL
jgi:hypothetical protein